MPRISSFKFRNVTVIFSNASQTIYIYLGGKIFKKNYETNEIWRNSKRYKRTMAMAKVKQ